MKKYIIVAAAVLSLCLTSCEDADDSSSQGASAASTTVSSSTEKVTEAFETAAATTEEKTTKAEVTETTAEKTTEPDITTEAGINGAVDWKTAYRAVLNSYKEENEYYDEAAWDLQDIDNDGLPELMISEGQFHVAGVRFYYYANGSASPVLAESGQQLQYGSYGQVLICPEKQLIGSSDMHMGYMFFGEYKYDNHSISTVRTFNENSGAVTDGNVEYIIDDEVVSQDEYQKVYDEFDKTNWELVGTQYSFDDMSPLD